MRRRLVVIALSCVVPLFLVACGKSEDVDPRTAPPIVRVAQVQPAAGNARTFTGTIAARVQSDLAFRVGGKVTERLVETGQTVRRGDVLYRIDPLDLNLAAASQQQAVNAARAQSVQATADEARYRDLATKGVVSRSAYDQIKAAADAASAQLKAAEAQSRVARNASQYTVLVADADGVVMSISAEPGQVVAAGQIVARLARAGSREALVQLPETLRPSIGSVASASAFGGSVKIPARLRVLSESADPATRTFEARYTLEEGGTALPLGSTVAVEMAGAVPAGASAGVEVPLGALFDPGTGPGVWVIGGKPLKARWMPVEVKQLGDDHALVAGALNASDRVAALGAHLLREGQLVRLADTASNAAADGVRP
ncbi:efflux RND transporter periplasmic adaptor subunit [Stenotrophomonas sp. CFBP 13725]|uniref:efflux RND transporter periplasmic adaptor subunit n=1 Tax=Stenotrophomonas sp. CFBP 13725 TaxID=2775297 RepID=UPI001786AAFA|nr:efflux RND transporter periplasmic adaptor subunit [Stenotrophomonas sp. CFBP 13725]MBD8634728.1 efflux RND transporter periplasmic adaptor subunit [Stenotrophomonas sp. CFBP 13725]